MAFNYAAATDDLLTVARLLGNDNPARVGTILIDAYVQTLISQRQDGVTAEQLREVAHKNIDVMFSAYELID